MIDEIKIMQLADGTLPVDEREEVQRAIDNDPKLNQLFKDYQKTGDILFNLGSELKSVPIPDRIHKKMEKLQSERKFNEGKKINFNFFNVFKFQYAGVAAAITIVFGAGFMTSNITMVNNVDIDNTVIPAMEKTIKMRGNLNLNNEDELSDKIAGLYRFIDEKKITKEFNKIESNLNVKDKIDLGAKDALGNKITFIYEDSFTKDGFECKSLTYDKKVQLSENDQGTNVLLNFCKVEKEFELTSIQFK